MVGRYKSAQEIQAIEAEAARLFLQARSSEAAEDWSKAYAWVALDPTHGFAFAKAEASWEISERLFELPMSQIGDEAVPLPTDNATAVDIEYRPPAMDRRHIFKWASAAAIVGLAGFAAFRGHGRVDHYRTAVGETRAIRLADGSVVRLNTDSSLDVALEKDTRSIKLLRGEAQFDVAHDKSRPFIVEAGGTQVRAVGTIFNVRLRSDVTELTVIDGIVAVKDRGSAAKRIGSGRSAAVRSGSVAVTQIDAAKMRRRVAWQEGLLQFDGDTLAQAVEEFNRYRLHPIVIGDPSIASLRIGGTFHVGRSQDFIAALESGFGVRAMAGDDASVLLVAAE